jgi:peptidyl-tRNA hydrolase
VLQKFSHQFIVVRGDVYMSKSKQHQTYKYIKNKSILNDSRPEVVLDSKVEYLLLKFFVVNTPCETTSRRAISLKEYGWKEKYNSKYGLQKRLDPIIDIDSGNYIFTDEDDLLDRFEENKLMDNMLEDIITERFVIGKTPESNKLLKLLRHIRNCFAHGKYLVVKNSIDQHMMIMQDNDNNNVTARIILRVNTLVEMIKIIDKDNSIGWKEILRNS